MRLIVDFLSVVSEGAGEVHACTLTCSYCVLCVLHIWLLSEYHVANEQFPCAHVSTILLCEYCVTYVWLLHEYHLYESPEWNCHFLIIPLLSRVHMCAW